MVPLKDLEILLKVFMIPTCITSLSSMLALQSEPTNNKINKNTKPMKMD